MSIKVDLNCDLGELGDSELDEQIMPFISSCNIASGGHAGNAQSIERTVSLAKKHGVSIGAHPSYPDKENFGRLVMEIQNKDLVNSLHRQILMVSNECIKQGAKLRHVKPHGALYNQLAKDKELSRVVCSIIRDIDPALQLYGLAHSDIESVANESKIVFIPEGFADRKYEADKTLMSRKKAGAVITDLAMVLAQVEELILKGRVDAEGWLEVKVKSVCLHSDTIGAVNLAKQIRRHLEKHGVQITSV